MNGTENGTMYNPGLNVDRNRIWREGFEDSMHLCMSGSMSTHLHIYCTHMYTWYSLDLKF